jgi:hypothetical protein
MFRMSQKRRPATTKHRTESSGNTDLHWSPPQPQNAGERLRQKNAVTLETAAWLDQFVWNWFATYTFAEPVSAYGAHYMFTRHLRFLERLAQMSIYAFRADEYGPVNGRFHMHALIGNVGSIPAFCGVRLGPEVWGRPCCAVHAWPCGFARVLEYDARMGATGYVTKYVVKEQFGDFDIYGDLIAAPSNPTLFDGELS